MRELTDIITTVIEKYDTLPKTSSHQILTHLWLAAKFLIGSTSKQIPYEVVYALDVALKEWYPKNFLITTALLDDLQYYFHEVDPSGIISKILPSSKLEAKLISVALPKLYRHKPIYNVALYHELGHFIDNTYKISELLTLTSPTKGHINHTREYFADLFAATYTGDGICKFLSRIAPNDPASLTHPSTKDRIDKARSLHSTSPDPLINAFNSILSARNLPTLGKRYQQPDISSYFNDIRPYPINNNDELHGILDAALTFLENIENTPTSPWTDMDEFEPERIVNDLLEKSIRNRMTIEKWSHGTT